MKIFRRKKRYNQLSGPLRILNYLLLFVLFASMILPFFNVLAVAFTSTQTSMNSGFMLFPEEFSLEGFIYMWTRQDIWRPLLNSLFVTTIGTFFQIFLSAIAGYVLLKKDLPYRRFIIGFILVTMMVPAELTLVSIYTLYRDLNLLNTYSGLIVNGLVSGVSIFLIQNYFKSIPSSVYEAALLDYSSEFMIFRKIYIPLSKPGLATVGFISFVSKWNSLMVPVSIISDADKFTMPMFIQSFIFDTTSVSGTDVIAPNAIMASIIISVVPLLIIYMIAQKYLVDGMTIGAVKG